MRMPSPVQLGNFGPGSNQPGFLVIFLIKGIRCRYNHSMQHTLFGAVFGTAFGTRRFGTHVSSSPGPFRPRVVVRCIPGNVGLSRTYPSRPGVCRFRITFPPHNQSR